MGGSDGVKSPSSTKRSMMLLGVGLRSKTKRRFAMTNKTLRNSLTALAVFG
jgi:hypothetical protein